LRVKDLVVVVVGYHTSVIGLFLNYVSQTPGTFDFFLEKIGKISWIICGLRITKGPK
jgi:hypothetical protein